MADLLAFVGVAVAVILTPGMDTTLTIRNTLRGGRRGGISTAFGVAAGQAVWILAASLGLASLLVASEPAFVALKALGALYLVWLGLRTLLAAMRGRAPVTAEGHATPTRGVSGEAFRQGALSNLGNPEMVVFFTSLFPQFAPRENALPVMLALGALFSTLTLLWLCVYAVVVARAGDILRRSVVGRVVDAVMGVVLVWFGGRLALERR